MISLEFSQYYTHEDHPYGPYRCKCSAGARRCHECRHANDAPVTLRAHRILSLGERQQRMREAAAQWLAETGQLPTRTSVPKRVVNETSITHNRVYDAFGSFAAFWQDLLTHGLCTAEDIERTIANTQAGWLQKQRAKRRSTKRDH